MYISVAEEIGMEKGIGIGMEKGIGIGMEKGRAELVRSLLSLGVDREKIAEAAGLTAQELEELEKEN